MFWLVNSVRGKYFYLPLTFSIEADVLLLSLILALMYVNPEKNKAIVFNYLVNNRFNITATERPVVLNGLNPNKKYSVKEINLFPGTTSTINSDKIYSGDFLMKAGINPNVSLKRTSVVLEINEVK